jgi:hypothetical protein
MTATVFLDEPIADGEHRLDCEDVRVIGNLLWATTESGGRETVVPLENVTGVTGDVVEQEVEEIETTGGLFTELVTDIS